MPQIVRSDYDAALVQAIDALPEWAIAALGERLVRVEHAPRPGCRAAERGIRVVVFREPSLSRARDLAELARFVGDDLVRAITLPDDALAQ